MDFELQEGFSAGTRSNLPTNEPLTFAILPKVLSVLMVQIGYKMVIRQSL